MILYVCKNNNGIIKLFCGYKPYWHVGEGAFCSPVKLDFSQFKDKLIFSMEIEENHSFLKNLPPLERGDSYELQIADGKIAFKTRSDGIQEVAINSNVFKIKKIK